MLNKEKLEFIPYYEKKWNYTVYTPCLLSCKELKMAEIVTTRSVLTMGNCRDQMSGSIQTENGANIFPSVWQWKAFSSDSLNLMEKQSCILYWEVRKINTVPLVYVGDRRNKCLAQNNQVGSAFLHQNGLKLARKSCFEPSEIFFCLSCAILAVLPPATSH